MSGVSMGSRSWDGVLAHAARAGGATAGGLVIGVRGADGTAWVTRSLPCPNPGSPNCFRVDPVAVANVRRSIQPLGEQILGIYLARTGDGPPEPGPTDAWVGPVCVVVGNAGEGRAWIADPDATGGVREAVLEIRAAALEPASCPE